MGTVVLVDEEYVASPPAEVFAVFGAGRPEAGWLFGAACDRVEPGGVVRFTLPAGHACGTLATGRITAIEHGARIVIRHEAPWPGRVTCTMKPEGAGTRVRVVAELDDDAIRWLLRQRDVQLPSQRATDRLVIGALISQSGPASVYTAASVNLVRLAADEVNRDGGLSGRAVHVAVADDGTDPATGAAEVRRLVEVDGCSVVFTNVTSATFRAVQPVAAAGGALLVYTPVNEGGMAGDRVLRLGERPAEQTRNAVPRLMAETGSRRWALAGSDYCWPRATNACARRAIERAHGTVAGEWYTSLGTRDFSPLLERIERCGAELVVSTLVGADEVAFERQFFDSGLRSRCRTLSLALDEATREHVGDRAAEGLWTVFGYFEKLPSRANAAFLRRYRDFVGPCPQPVSSISESMYEAVHLYAQAVRSVRTTDPTAVGRALASTRFDGPRGRVRMNGPGRLEQSLYLAESVQGGFEILDQV
jgi:branched-chain amino acid transport system substrate-binding protein